MLKTTSRLVLLAALLAIVAAACGGGSDDEASATTDVQSGVTSTMDMTDGDGEDHDEEYAFGQPAESSEADRTIEIEAKDDFSFDPAEIVVSAGETVTFVVTNTGAIPHDFTLGDETTQDAHEKEMTEMIEKGEMMEHADPNTMALESGETKAMTWTFSETGTVLIGCHQPGHYLAGMKGSVEVES